MEEQLNKKQIEKVYAMMGGNKNNPLDHLAVKIILYVDSIKTDQSILLKVSSKLELSVYVYIVLCTKIHSASAFGDADRIANELRDRLIKGQKYFGLQDSAVKDLFNTRVKQYEQFLQSGKTKKLQADMPIDYLVRIISAEVSPGIVQSGISGAVSHMEGGNSEIYKDLKKFISRIDDEFVDDIKSAIEKYEDNEIVEEADDAIAEVHDEADTYTINREAVFRNIQGKTFSLSEIVGLSEHPIKEYIVDLKEYETKAGEILAYISEEDRKNFIVDLYILKDQYDEDACLDVIRIFNRCSSSRVKSSPSTALINSNVRVCVSLEKEYTPQLYYYQLAADHDSANAAMEVYWSYPNVNGEHEEIVKRYLKKAVQLRHLKAIGIYYGTQEKLLSAIEEGEYKAYAPLYIKYFSKEKSTTEDLEKEKYCLDQLRNQCTSEELNEVIEYLLHNMPHFTFSEYAKKSNFEDYLRGRDNEYHEYRQKRKQFVAQSQSRPTKGCYVATAIYGSYNCPQVWVLRRYRDNVLAHNFFGRIFIKIYYFLSPTAVKIFGKTKLFNFLVRKLLDKKVCKLKKRGFTDTEYFD